MKTQLGVLCPIVILAQNPTIQGGTYTADQQSVQYRAQIGVDNQAFAAATAGCYGVDLWPAFTDPVNDVNADGLHPNAQGSAKATVRLAAALAVTS